MRSSRSKTTTSCPARASCCAAASPAGPEPTTATRLPVLSRGGCGTNGPSAMTWSAMLRSIALMVTGSSRRFSTHEASHGAGHTRPVTSGKLFVSWRRRAASSMRPLCTRSFHSGMMFPSGHPW